MQFNIWSFDHGEPSLDHGCVAQLPSTRWATLDCNLPLPFACLLNTSTTMIDWHVDLSVTGTYQEARCPDGYQFYAPHNGYANNILSLKGMGQTIWINAPNPRQL